MGRARMRYVLAAIALGLAIVCGSVSPVAGGALALVALFLMLPN